MLVPKNDGRRVGRRKARYSVPYVPSFSGGCVLNLKMPLTAVLFRGFVLFAVLIGFVLPAMAQSNVIATTKSSKGASSRTRKRASTARRRTASTIPFAEDDTRHDDPVVREAAVKALGNFHSAALVSVDPTNGRILTIVNQKLAFESYQPCSTFKPAIALAALEEGLIEKDKTRLQLGRRWYLDLTRSLTISNNLYFEKLGGLLGLEKMRDYAQRFGFGELSSWGLPDEPRGAVPTKAPPASRGGVGRIASFGEGIEQTPLQLASFISAVANGGTLFYLQYPMEEGRFEPLVKRRLEIGPWLDPVREGLEGAVLKGTARRAKQPDVTILGKTGTCRQDGARLGWFAGYSQEKGGLAVAVLLRGGPVSGPLAAGLAGNFFRNLADQNYVAQSARVTRRSAPAAAAFTSLR
jgi:penicillin-binding protein 2